MNSDVATFAEEDAPAKLQDAAFIVHAYCCASMQEPVAPLATGEVPGAPAEADGPPAEPEPAAEAPAEAAEPVSTAEETQPASPSQLAELPPSRSRSPQVTWHVSDGMHSLIMGLLAVLCALCSHISVLLFLVFLNALPC